MAITQGIAFPWRGDSTGLPAVSDTLRSIRDSIITILLTVRGTRVMRPRFGSAVLDYLFTSDTAAATAFLQTEIVNAIAQNESRVVVQTVTITPVLQNRMVGKLIEVTYFVPSLQVVDQVSVPVTLAASQAGP